VPEETSRFLFDEKRLDAKGFIVHTNNTCVRYRSTRVLCSLDEMNGWGCIMCARFECGIVSPAGRHISECFSYWPEASN
jgi:hypothetical protein